MIIFKPITSFSLAGFDTSVHGLFMALGVFVAYLFARRRIRSSGLSVETFENLLTVMIVSGLIGARVVFLFFQGSDMSLLDMLAIWKGGLSSHGGFIFASVASFIYLKWKRLDVTKYFDALAPYVLLGWSIGRIGDFLSWGEYGVASTLPWAINAFGTPRHPTQIYESILYLASFFFVIVLRKYRHLAPGVTTAIATGSFAASRFFIDFFRADDPQYRLFSQIVTAAIVLLVAGYLLWKKWGHHKPISVD